MNNRGTILEAIETLPDQYTNDLMSIYYNCIRQIVEQEISNNTDLIWEKVKEFENYKHSYKSKALTDLLLEAETVDGALAAQLLIEAVREDVRFDTWRSGTLNSDLLKGYVVKQ